jgi:hypothetical protein
MNLDLKGAAKRLLFSLSLAASLGGCAVYEPYPASYTAYDPYGYRYPYGQPAYGDVPAYVGPPVSLDLWFGSHRGHGFRGPHGHGFRGHHGHHRHHGLGHRGWRGGGHHGGWGHGHRGGRR